MTAVYRMEKNPPKEGSGKQTVLHPRIIPWDTVDTEAIINEGSRRSTYTRGDLEGAIRVIADLLAENLENGNNVYLDGIGYFSVSLRSRPVENKNELRSESVHFKNVNFRCCAKLRKKLRTIKLERYREPKKSDFSEEEKERRLLWYLDRHAYITTLAYQGLNACTQYQARKDLKQFVANNILEEKGTRKMCLYMKRSEVEELPGKKAGEPSDGDS